MTAFPRHFAARVQKLRRTGKDPWDIFLKMHGQARRFYEPMEAVGHQEMLKLAERYDGIWCYVHILGRIADGLDSGVIQLSPSSGRNGTRSSKSPDPLTLAARIRLSVSFMHGQPPPTNPLHAAARETMAVARETKSPWFECMAMIVMAASALVTTAIGALQVRHM